MAHLSPDRLAALAAGPDDPTTPAEHEHLASCAACRAEAGTLADLVRDIREARTDELHAPPPGVWSGVENALAHDGAGAGGTGGAAAPAAAAAGRARRWLRVGAAAAAGLVVGVGGTLGLVALRGDDAGDLVARTALAALPGESGEGTAELVREDDALRLRVHAALGPSPARDHHEVWLVNGDGRRMYALGVLPSSGDGSYWLPPGLDDRLDGYATVDISLEADDGDATHSRHSLVQGRLPG